MEPVVDGSGRRLAADATLTVNKIDASDDETTLTVGATLASKIEIGRAGQDVEIKGTLTTEPSISNGVQKRTVTVAYNNAALVAANSNGGAATVNIGATLPANARILGVDMRALTPFTGGSASAVTVDVGTSADVDALVDGADVFAAAVDGGPTTMPAGVRPNKTFATVGAQLIATFAPDGGHQLANLTAGSVIIDVLFTVLP